MGIRTSTTLSLYEQQSLEGSYQSKSFRPILSTAPNHIIFCNSFLPDREDTHWGMKAPEHIDFDRLIDTK